MFPDNTLLLRALKLNAIFSGFSALCMFILGSWLAAQFAQESAVNIYVTAGILAAFALQLTNIVRTKNIRAWEVIGIIIADIAWVVVSVALVVRFYGAITPTAVVLVDLVAVAVLFFAVMQIRGFLRYRNPEIQH